MTVSVWRIGTTFGAWRADDLSGAAAAKVGGRYNSVGTAVVYCSSNVALTVLETVVHMAVRSSATTANRYLIEIEVPDTLFQAREIIRVKDMARKKMPFWDAVPFSTQAQQIGDQWVKGNQSLLLEVPSAILPYHAIPDVNLLINPAHPDFSQLKIGRRDRFIYDPRLM